MGAVQYDHQDESEKRLNPSTVGLQDSMGEYLEEYYAETGYRYEGIYTLKQECLHLRSLAFTTIRLYVADSSYGKEGIINC